MSDPATPPSNEEAINAIILLIQAAYTGSDDGPSLPPIHLPLHPPAETPQAVPVPLRPTEPDDGSLTAALVTVRRWVETLPVVHSWHKQ